jgi:hypothetical protein
VRDRLRSTGGKRYNPGMQEGPALPFVELLTQRRPRRISATHLYRYVAAAGADIPPRKKRRNNPVIEYLAELLATYSFGLYPPLRAAADWDLPHYIFPIPSPPFAEQLFPADGIALQPRSPSGGHKLVFDCEMLFAEDPERAIEAVNAALAQAAAVCDSAVPPQVAQSGTLAAEGQWFDDPDLQPRTTAHELRQAHSLLRWCVPAGKHGHDLSTVELWRHLAGSPLLAVRLSALRGLDYCGQAPPLLVLDEALAFLQQEQFVPRALQAWGEQRKHGRLHTTVLQRAYEWQDACEDLARLLYPGAEFQLVLQCALKPDIALPPFQLDAQGRVIRCARIIDAKTGETASIAKYREYADTVDAWHLKDGPALAEQARAAGNEPLAQRILRLSRIECGPELLFLERLRERYYP